MIKLDCIATVLWIIMDVLWMWGQPSYGVFLSPLILVAIMYAFKKTKSHNMKVAMGITIQWLILNVLWMSTDIFNDAFTIILFKSLATGFAVSAFITMGYLKIDKK